MTKLNTYSKMSSVLLLVGIIWLTLMTCFEGAPIEVNDYAGSTNTTNSGVSSGSPLDSQTTHESNATITESLTTNATAEPELNAPELLSPSCGAEVCRGSQTFSWDSVEGATSYQLNIYTGTDTSGDPDLSYTINETEVTPIQGFIPDVYSIELTSVSATQTSSPLICQITVADDPVIPTGLNAVNGCQNQSITLSWEDGQTYGSYQVEIDYGSGYGTTGISSVTSSQAHLISPNFGTFSWKVQHSVEACSDQAVSTPASITISQAPVLPTNLTTATGYYGRDIPVTWESDQSYGTYIVEVDTGSGYSDAEVVSHTTNSAVLNIKAVGDFAWRVRHVVDYCEDAIGMGTVHTSIEENCQCLANQFPAYGSGLYYIDPIDPSTGSQAFQTYCNMDIDGGGWTLVASSADGSIFLPSDNDNFTIRWDRRIELREIYTSTTAQGDATQYLTQDVQLDSYSKVSFTEMLFLNDQDEYLQYSMTGTDVSSWFDSLYNGMDYSNQINNCSNNECTGATANDIFSPAQTNLGVGINACNSLEVRFLQEDSDTIISHEYHGFGFGPAWRYSNNDGCPWDEGGLTWTSKQLGGQNNEASAYILWLVRDGC